MLQEARDHVYALRTLVRDLGMSAERTEALYAALDVVGIELAREAIGIPELTPMTTRRTA